MTKSRDELARRRAKLRRSLQIRIGLASAVTAVLLYVVYFSSMLSVTSVSVVDNIFAQSDAVIKAAGIEIGTPIARLNSGEIAARIEKLPAVKAVEVRRAWPHKIVLAIVEPTPIAVVGTAGRWQYVDDQGDIFGFVAKKPLGLLTVAAHEKPARAAAAKVAAQLPQWLMDRVKWVSAGSPDDVRLKLAGGDEVRWGSPDRMQRKAQVLKALLTMPARVYDVSAPDVPITRK